MSYRITGQLFIDSSEFWEFVRTNSDAFPGCTFTKIRFTNASHDMEVDYTAFGSEATTYIDLVTLWEFVSTYVPFEDAETAFGVPVLNDFNLEIEWAASDIDSPFDWANTPRAVEQWNSLRKKS